MAWRHKVMRNHIVMSLIALNLCDINDVDTTINITLNSHPSHYALLEPVIPHAAEFREGGPQS